MLTIHDTTLSIEDYRIWERARNKAGHVLQTSAGQEFITKVNSPSERDAQVPLMAHYREQSMREAVLQRIRLTHAWDKELASNAVY